jgi:hypothetical protein
MDQLSIPRRHSSGAVPPWNIAWNNSTGETQDIQIVISIWAMAKQSKSDWPCGKGSMFPLEVKWSRVVT